MHKRRVKRNPKLRCIVFNLNMNGSIVSSKIDVNFDNKRDMMALDCSSELRLAMKVIASME